MQRDEDAAHRAKVATRLIFEGKIRSAVCYVTEREGGGIMTIHAIDKKWKASGRGATE